MSSKNPIFISYAPEDRDAAQRIAAALQESGIESRIEDTAGRNLQAEIKASALFLPIMSQHAASQPTGRFREEWEIAAKHMDSLPRGVPFLLPIIVDDTEEYGMAAPSAFSGVHWIRQPNGATTPELVEEVVRLLTIPRGPVYFPPIPPGLSRPPFSTKKRTRPAEQPATTGPSKLPWIAGGATLLLLLAVGAWLLGRTGGEDAAPAPPTAVATPVASVPTTPAPVEEPPAPLEPPPLTGEALLSAFETARLAHDYTAAADLLRSWLDEQINPDLPRQLQLAWIELSRDLDPERYLEQVGQILPPDPVSGEHWLPPVAYGLKRDFANQRRAIRAGMGRLHLHFPQDSSGTEIALTESYMEQGNWTLARHYGNQARNTWAEPLSDPSVSPLVAGQFEAFLLMSRRDPAATELLTRLQTEFPDDNGTTELLLIRAWINRGEHDRAMTAIEQGLSQPGPLDPATVLFLAPFDQLHDHPAFHPTLSAHVDPARLDNALQWMAAISGPSSPATATY